jgi:hypothetical protein
MSDWLKNWWAVILFAVIASSYAAYRCGLIPYTTPYYYRRFSQYYQGMMETLSRRPYDCQAVRLYADYLSDPALIKYIISTPSLKDQFPTEPLRVGNTGCMDADGDPIILS